MGLVTRAPYVLMGKWRRLDGSIVRNVMEKGIQLDGLQVIDMIVVFVKAEDK
jgi:hypothetical protein